MAAPAWLNVVCSRSRGGIDQRRQRVNVGSFELRELPVFQHLARDFMLGRQAFQHIRGGGNCFAFAVLHRRGQIQFLKQNLSQLLRRIDIERLAGQLVDLGREPLDGRRPAARRKP